MTPPSLRSTGALLVTFALSLQIPYAILVARFGYDDILREPTPIILARFHDGGAVLVLAWLAFAFGALCFLPLSLRIDDALGVRRGWTGPASAVLQFLGLARWGFAVPGLAAHTDPPDAQHAAEVVFHTLHQYLGVVLGEITGQLLLVAWTLGLALHLWARGDRLLAAWGLLTVPFWLVGLSEPLATILPDLRVVEVTPIAFIGWQLWLLLLGLVWAWRPTAPSPLPPGA